MLQTLPGDPSALLHELPLCPGTPQQDLLPSLQAAIDPPRASPSSARAALQTPLPSALGWASIWHHLSCPLRTSFPEELWPGCPLPKRLCFVWCLPCSPTLSPLPRCQVVLPPTSVSPPAKAQGSVMLRAAPSQGLGWGQPCLMASPGAGHIWAAKPVLPGDNRLGSSPRHPRCIHWIPLLVLLPHWDLTLPIGGRPLRCCCQGTCTGTHSGATPRWLSQLITVRGRGDDIPAPAKTNTAPSKHAGLGKPAPRPSITEPAALQPTTAWPGSGAGENQQGAWGGSRHPPPPPLCCWLKDGALSFIPFLGLGTCPGLPAPTRCCYGVLSDARGVRPQPLGTQRVPRVGTAHPQGGCAEGRVPCSCWLGPRRKVGQSHLQALTIINPAPASICHWGWSSKGPDIPNICRRECGRQRAIRGVLGGPGRTHPLHSVLGQWQQSMGQPFQRARFSLEEQILLLPHIPFSCSWAGSCSGLHMKPGSLRAVACG